MDDSPLPDQLQTTPTSVVVVLFSQTDCVYCREVREHYLRPIALRRPARLTIAEIETGSTRVTRDWRGAAVTHAAFAKASGVHYMPTLMFFDAKGATLAPPIVGLSRDFFGAYLDTRIATALQAAQ